MRKRRLPVVESLECRQLLAMFANGIDSENLGKGMWGWNLKNAMTNAGFTYPTQMDSFFQWEKNTQGLQYFITKAADSGNLYNNGSGQNYTTTVLNSARNAGLKILPYFYIYGRTDAEVTAEIAVFNNVMDNIGGDGVVFDIEGEWAGGVGGTVSNTRIVNYFNGIGKSQAGDGSGARDNLFMAYSSFPYVSVHGEVPWLKLGDYCDATMPQAYWSEWNTVPVSTYVRQPASGVAMTPTRIVDDMNSQYNQISFDNRHTVWYGHPESIKPVILIGMTYDGGANTTTAAEITEFINAAKASTQVPTTGPSGVNSYITYGYRGLNFFDENSTSTAERSAIAAGTVGVTPSAPSSPTPANNATGVTPTGLVLDWADSAVTSTGAKALSYDVYFDGVLKANVTGSSWTVTPAITGGAHTWQVVAKNFIGNTAGPTWTFTASLVYPGTPSNPVPANNAILTTSPTKLDWADASDATSYDLYLGTTVTPINVTVSEWSYASSPADGTRLWRVVAKNPNGTTAGPQWQYILDRVAPTATYNNQLPTNGAAYLDFTVTYADATTGVDYASLGTGDITVTGPNGYAASATLVSVDTPSNGTPRIATYRIPAPGGSWNPADNGTYTIAQNATQLKDVAGNWRSAGTIGTFNAGLQFAWMSGSTMNVDFDGSGLAVTLEGAGADINAIQGSTTLSFSGVTSIVINGTSGTDTLNSAGPIAAPIQLNGGGGSDVLNVQSGTYTLGSDISATAPGLSINVASGAAAVFNSTQHIAGLSVSAGATLTQNSGTLYTSDDVVNAGTVELVSGAEFGGAGKSFSNAGTLNVRAATTISTAVSQLSGSTLTGGTWNVVGAALTLSAGSNITINQANVTLDGAGASFAKMGVLSSNGGTLAVINGASFSTAGNLANTGTLSVGSGSALTVNGDLSQQGAAAFGGTLNANGSASFGATTTWGPGSVLNTSSGTASFTADAGPAANLTINAAGGALSFAVSQRLAGLNLSGSARATLAPGGERYLHVDGLSVGASAALDLNDNDLIVEYGTNISPFDAIRDLVFGGYSATADSGKTGIVSSSGQAAGNTILALLDNALVGASEWPIGSGHAVGANAVLGKYTFFGDANIDGQVTSDDYALLDSNLETTPAPALAWLSGDANLDGSVTSDDYAILDANLGAGAGGALAPAGAKALSLERGAEEILS